MPGILQINGESLQINGQDLQINAVENPRVTAVEVSDALITGADAGGTFTVTVTFSEAMDTGVTPTITFSPDVSTTLTFSSGAWSVGDTTYTASYSIADANVEVADVEIDVTGAEDADGNAQTNYAPEAEFSIDTLDAEPEPEPEPQPGRGGGRLTGGSFSRKKWKEYLDAKRAAQEAAAAVEQKPKATRKAIEKAVEETQAALVTAPRDKRFDELARMLDAAVAARKSTEILANAHKAAKLAIKIADEAEEEEEAIVFLTLH